MRFIGKLLFVAFLIFVHSVLIAGPTEDKAAYQNYFKGQFPNVEFGEYINGIYAIDQGLREQWEAIEELPPYNIAIDDGEEIAKRILKSGKTIASCFKKDGFGAAANYPYFDIEKGKVMTLVLAINDCLEKNGEDPMEYQKGPIAAVVAYFAAISRGLLINIKDPSYHPAALRAYKKGKQFYYARRGQLNVSCAHCHVDHVGKLLRANFLGPGLGQVTHFPVYRSKWGDVGTLHRRIIGCMKQMRAAPFEAQSEQFRNLEYFMTYMSNGLTWNGPGARF